MSKQTNSALTPTAPGAEETRTVSAGRAAAEWIGMIVLSAVFVAAMEFAGLPAAFLIGPMIGAIIFSVTGHGPKMPAIPYRISQMLVGCMIASMFSLDVLGQVGADWPLFVLGVFSVLLISTCLGLVLSRLDMLPGTTAIWGSFPGAATVMTLMSANFGADMRLVAFMQYSRVIVVALLAALVAHFVAGNAAAPVSEIQWFAVDGAGFAGTIGVVIFTLLVAHFFRIPSAPLLVPVVLGVVLKVSGLVSLAQPQILLSLAYVFVGWGIGLRFDREVISYVARAMPRVFGAIFILVALSAGMGGLLVVFAGIDPLSAYLATSPGGADTVAIISAATNVDVPFIMAMQLARFFVIMIFGPSLAQLVVKWSGTPHIKSKD